MNFCARCAPLQHFSLWDIFTVNAGLILEAKPFTHHTVKQIYVLSRIFNILEYAQERWWLVMKRKLYLSFTCVNPIDGVGGAFVATHFRYCLALLNGHKYTFWLFLNIKNKNVGKIWIPIFFSTPHFKNCS